MANVCLALYVFSSLAQHSVTVIKNNIYSSYKVCGQNSPVDRIHVRQTSTGEKLGKYVTSFLFFSFQMNN